MQFLKDYGVVLFFVAQTTWFALEWWFRKSLVTKDDLTKVDKKVTETIGQNKDLARRIESLEVARSDAPSKNDILKLRLEMERARGDMRVFTERMQGAEKIASAQMEGVHQLLSRSEDLVRMLTENQLNHGR
jgi:hypothetical protein